MYGGTPSEQPGAGGPTKIRGILGEGPWLERLESLFAHAALLASVEVSREVATS